MFFYRGKDYLSKFSKTLKAQLNKIINIEQKPMNPLTEQEKMLHANANICFICEKPFGNDKNAIKVRDHCHYTGNYRRATRSACNLQYKMPKRIPVVFHNSSNYDFHLIVKQVPFSCFGENTEKYITFSICIFKKTEAGKKPIAYQIKFIDSFRHMPQSLSNLVDNLAELNKNLPATTLINRFSNTNKISDNNIKTFMLLLLKGVYPYEYMRSWKNFKEPVSLDKISDSDIEHIKIVCEAFNITDLGEYHDLYLSLDVALLADVFENFRDTTIDIDKLDPAYYLSAPGLSWQSFLKKTGVTSELLTDKDMLLLFEKVIRGGTCNAVCKYVKANNKYMKNYDKTKESIFLVYVDANNLYGWVMSEKLPVDKFTWETDLSIFTDGFIKNYDSHSDTGYIFYVDITYPKEL